MTDTLNLFIGLAMGLNLLALASSRLPSVIRAAALQGMVLGILPLLIEHDWQWMVVLVSIGTIAVKGFVIPHLLRRALRAANIDREIEAADRLCAVAVAGGGGHGWRGGAGRRAAVAAGTRRIHCWCPVPLPRWWRGFLMLMGRTKAISQVCGYLILENGIYLFGLLLINSTPLLVEAGILLDLTVAVFVIGIIMDRIQKNSTRWTPTN